ncbi:MAG: GNAT family N-acetyltransferase [Christensenellaceae bacterium]
MITNKWFNGIENAKGAVDLRREVFVQEQQIPEEGEFDALDSQAMHLVVYDGETPVATGRVVHDGKTFRIGRLAVKKDCRGQGFGDLLIKLLLLKVFEFGPSVVRISAQTYAQAFYERYGFRKTGDEFMEEGIPHIPMEVTKETLVFKSKCGHDKTFWDFFEEAGPEQSDG